MPRTCRSSQFFFGILRVAVMMGTGAALSCAESGVAECSSRLCCMMRVCSRADAHTLGLPSLPRHTSSSLLPRISPLSPQYRARVSHRFARGHDDGTPAHVSHCPDNPSSNPAHRLFSFLCAAGSCRLSVPSFSSPSLPSVFSFFLLRSVCYSSPFLRLLSPLYSTFSVATPRLHARQLSIAPPSFPPPHLP